MIGTPEQISDAHKALDRLGVAPGALAIRVLAAVAIVDRLRSETVVVYGCNAVGHPNNHVHRHGVAH